MNDRELDFAIALAMDDGRERCASGDDCMWASVPSEPHWHDDRNGDHYAPGFATSVDALAPVEERLRQAGGHLESHVLSTRAAAINGYVGMSKWLIPGTDLPYHHAPTEKRSRAEAAYEALTILNAIQVEGEVAK